MRLKRINNSSIIVAQCTPTGSGALALLRLSGQGVFELVDSFCALASKKKISEVTSHTVHFGYVKNGSEVVDHVMFIAMRGPKTFTGEDVIEITCHNNPFIIEEIINLAIKNGARLAQRGEFAKRSYLNGKIDLVQAESINELIHSSNQQTLKKSLSQLEGSLSSFVQNIEKQLLQCLALSEASFEFLDDEMDFKDQIIKIIDSIKSEVNRLLDSHKNQQNIREGIRVAILGTVNAGKSSLFNSLIKTDRAIVTNIEGTTRDVIEAGVYTSDSYVTFVDTAGIRQTDDIIEKEGINRSFKEAEKADVIVLVADSSRVLKQEEKDFYLDVLGKYKEKVIFVQNKFDIAIENQFKDFDSINVSVKSKNGVKNLESQLHKKIKTILDQDSSSFLINKRHYNLLLDLSLKLKEIDSLLLKAQVEHELLSIHLNDALSGLSEISGKNVSEMAMDAVFKEFCVGK